MVHNIIFINRFHKVRFYKVRTKLRNKITQQNYKASKHNLMSRFKTFDSKQKSQYKAQKDEKLVFQKKLQKIQTYIKLY